MTQFRAITSSPFAAERVLPPCITATTAAGGRGAASRPRATVTEHHGVDDQDDQRHADRQGCEPEDLQRLDESFLQRLDHVFLEAALGHELLVLARAVLLELLERDPAREDHGIHGEPVGPEMRVEEVDREDESGRQQRLVRMDDGRHVDEPTGQEIREELGEPQDQAAEPDHADAPEHGEVVELLPVSPAPVTGPFTLAHEPLDGGDELFAVPLVEEHALRPEDELPPGLARDVAPVDQVDDVAREVEEGDQRAHAVQGARRLEAAEDVGQPLGPAQVAELQDHARDRQGQEADDYQDVQSP
jgi:hypothetical protein